MNNKLKKGLEISSHTVYTVTEVLGAFITTAVIENSKIPKGKDFLEGLAFYALLAVGEFLRPKITNWLMTYDTENPEINIDEEEIGS